MKSQKGCFATESKLLSVESPGGGGGGGGGLEYKKGRGARRLA